MFSGAITAAITPFKNSLIDFASFQSFINWQYQQGINTVVIAGCTGESSLLSNQERKQLAEASLEVASNNKDMRIIFGIVANSTEEAIRSATEAEKIGVHAIMLMSPAYSKAPQDGLYNHFKQISLATNLPIIIYNHPGRTGVDLSDETLAKLAAQKNIVAVKDSSGDLKRPLTLAPLITDKPHFNMLAADDIAAIAFNLHGGVGCISVASNIVPALIKEVQNHMLIGDFIAASNLHKKLVNLYISLFSEVNPVPVKYAAYLIGKIPSYELRSPLIEPTDSIKSLIKRTLIELNLL